MGGGRGAGEGPLDGGHLGTGVGSVRLPLCRPPERLPLACPCRAAAPFHSFPPGLASPPLPSACLSPPPNPTFTLPSEGGGPGCGGAPPRPSPGQRCRRNAELWRVEEAEESPSSQRRSPPPGLGAAAARSKVGGGAGQARAGQAAFRSWDPLQECSPPCQGNLGRLSPTNGLRLCLQEAGGGWEGADGADAGDPGWGALEAVWGEGEGGVGWHGGRPGGGHRAAGRVPPPVCLAATGTGVTDGPVDAEPALPSACRTPVPAGWAAGAVPLVSAAARDSRGGCCLRVLLQSRAARACVMLNPSSAPSRSWR